jgi:hypothetical protein
MNHSIKTISSMPAATSFLAIALAIWLTSVIPSISGPTSRLAWGANPEKSPSGAPHPLDPALKIAEERLRFLQDHVRDYTCTIVKRERVKDVLGDYQYMFAKIRHRNEMDGKVVTPFSVYLRFVKPESIAGREVIWVEGKNNGSMIVHETGLLNVKRLSLDPNGILAMMGQRYPVSKIGILNLVDELIQKGKRDRKHSECEVQFFKNAQINKRPCTMIQVVHPVKRDYFDFHKVQIFIDVKLNVPVRYAAWLWPEEPGAEAPLLEEYTYLDVELNPGLTDKDFDPDNPEYQYPKL